MLVKCANGIIDTNTDDISKQDQAALGIVYVGLSREAIRAGQRWGYKTTASMVDVQAYYVAKTMTAEQKAAAEAEKRATYLTGLTDAELLAFKQQAWDAEMELPNDMQKELIRRNLAPKPNFKSSNPDFSAYVAAQDKAEREGRSDEFEDGVW